MISKHNYTGNKQKSQHRENKNVRAALEQVKSNTEYVRGLINLATTKRTTVRMIKQAGIVAQVNKMKHDFH
jgi:hypothetical protein